MSGLLTVKEVQDLLKIDRITVYRMLKDGRLTGLKIGHQWRFSQDEIDALLCGVTPATTNGVESRNDRAPLPTQALPLHCVQVIQKVFAEVAQVGAVTTAPDGEPLTEFSNSCRFCTLVMGTEKGRAACVASWERLSHQREQQPRFATCHAGLQYARARIELNGELAGMLVTGQFYAQPPDPEEEAKRVAAIAEKFGIDHAELSEAARDLTTLDDRKRAQLGDWLQSVAHTFEDIGRERTELMSRLRTIAAMSTLESV